jgi:hypothetical protein
MLGSPGGVFVSALNMAATIKQRQLVTFVEEKQNYVSACSIIFFACEQRAALGELGAHQM